MAMSPQRRLRLARWLFVGSLVLLPPAVLVTVLWPALGTVILQIVSFLAITLTAWDILQTADVRKEQEKE
jgi:hypothetical protein